MSYHEGESSSLKDPSTAEQELSKSSDIECAVKNDSGVNDQSDISSHDNDMIAYCCVAPMWLASLNPFIEFRIWNNSSSSDVLYIQGSISISPKYESK